ncbi:hypothetical protein ACSBR1_021345 [Camellia fascicularis]
MGMFFNCMGFTASSHVDPIDRSGGIWLLWNPNVVNVRVVEASSQQITATISRQDYPDWLLSAVYASPSSVKRDELWEQLEAIAQYTTDPWLVAGDFNDFTSPNDKRSFHGRSHQNLSQDQRRSSKFNDRINHCKLMDLGCAGPRLTWSNNRKGWANTMVRLDRAMCNTEWRTTFPDGAVRNLPRTYSDHSPMMVFTQGKSPFLSICKPFKFLAAWITHKDFKKVVDGCWGKTHFSLCSKLQTLSHKASVWNKEVFGNIFRRKRWLLGRIEGIQASQAINYSHNLHNLELDLVDQYNTVLYQEELLWFQKARANWITQGERNTKYFHLTTLNKRRRRTIEMLRDDHGYWVDQVDQLKNLVNSYFVNLFSDPRTVSLDQWSNLVECVPLIHGRVNRRHFNDIIERMQKRLAGWKTSVLSMAGRATLIKSVSAAIPSYTMQTTIIPKKVSNVIDKLNRDFLWGDTLDKRKVHLVKWDVVCKVKKQGGLGIKKARDQNLALLTKLGWNLVSNKASLWCEVSHF